MANREPPYDPYIPSGNGAAGDYPAHNGRTAALQAQIDDTVTVMKQNINKVAERGENLDHLGQQTEVLQQKSQDFTKRARAVRLEMRWKNNKMKIWIGLAVLFIILVVVIPLAVHFK